MKRIIAMFLTLAMVTVAFAGCGGSPASSTASGGSSSKADSPAADESWTKVEQAGKLVLGLDPEFPPMGYKDTSSGDIIGFDIDLAKEVCSRLNIKLEAQPINWDSKQLELDGGNIDCIWNGLSWTQERADNMYVTKPYMNNKQVLMTLKGSDYTSMASLNGQSLAVQKDSSAEAALNSDDNKAFKDSLKEVVGVDSYTNGLMELKNGTVVALGIDEVVARWYMEQEPDKYELVQKDGADASLANEDYIIGFRKGDTALANKIYDTLKEMKADGKLAEISKVWFGKDITVIK
ncbi:MAG TPA: amino acid ABC transporter substrate-binding protein [Clostridiales bacterium]|nr:amino acid ABC transporter substrate-binding protein [Clostridiales bacterium]